MRLFPMISGQGRALLAQAGGALAIAALIAGCGDNYRPTVTPVYTTGPAAQPTSYAVVVSTTGASTDGVVTLIDYSGDSILTEATIGPGPTAFTLDELGATGYTVNSDGTLSNFAITTSLQTKNVSFSTLSPTAQIVNLMPPSSGLWATDLNGDVVDLFQGSPQAFKLAIPVATSASPATMPMFIAGSPTLSGQREYVISQNVADTAPMTCNLTPRTVAVNGVATPIEISSNTTDPAIPVGKCPVYAVPSTDQQRLFVLNRGDDTIYGHQHPEQHARRLHALPESKRAMGDVPSRPFSFPPVRGRSMRSTCRRPSNSSWPTTRAARSVSIDVPLDEYGNDSNTYANNNCTTYAACGAITGGFGTVHTVAVGNTATPNPASVTVLYDGSKAYTANQNDGATERHGDGGQPVHVHGGKDHYRCRPSAHRGEHAELRVRQDLRGLRPTARTSPSSSRARP